ncbi:MAG: tetratricopeptide repeat protein, partial [Desulfobacterales bacterium]
LREHSFDLARQESLRVLEIAPRNYQAKLILGNAFMLQKNFEKAKEAFESLIQLEPENPTGYFHLGLAYHKEGDEDRARTELKKALDLDQNFDGADEARQILSKLQG